MNEFSRLELLFDNSSIKILKNSHIAVFGIGGVGGNCVESLARSAVSNLTIYDNDSVSLTNINRQVIALHSTIGKDKVAVMKERLLDINPNIKVSAEAIFIDSETIKSINFKKFDYIVDAIDTVTSKLLLIKKAKEYNIPIISCMGTGNKLDPTKLAIMDISKTMYCPLARVIRRELKQLNIKHVKVLSSYEEALKPKHSDEHTNKTIVPGSTSFVPSVAGIIISKEVILDLIRK